MGTGEFVGGAVGSRDGLGVGKMMVIALEGGRDGLEVAVKEGLRVDTIVVKSSCRVIGWRSSCSSVGCFVGLGSPWEGSA